MNDSYTLSDSGGITTIKLFENPSYDLVKSIIDELAEHELYLRRLWDLREINFDWSTSMLQDMAEYGKSKFLKPNKAAFVVDNDLAFGEMRIFMVYREEQGKTIPNVFRDYDQAIEFLNS